MIMKQKSLSYHELVLSLVCLLLISSSSYSTSASRFLIPNRVGKEMVDAAASLSQADDIGQQDSWNLLMDGEKCGGNEVEDEECLKRRMMSEAHLDYIYTQHQNP